jgi:hypothetical protein
MIALWALSAAAGIVGFAIVGGFLAYASVKVVLAPRGWRPRDREGVQS